MGAIVRSGVSAILDLVGSSHQMPVQGRGGSWPVPDMEASVGCYRGGGLSALLADELGCRTATAR